MSEGNLKDDQSAKQRTWKSSAEKSLPRSSADQLVKIIKAFAVASNGGEFPIRYKEVAGLAGLAANAVSGNLNFLQESLVLTQPLIDRYRPTEGAVRFAREAAWDEEGAKKHLRGVISESWYGQLVIHSFVLRPSFSRDEFQMSLAIRCGATEGDADALGFLIDFILYSNLAVSDDSGVIRRGNIDESASNPDNVSHLDQTAPVQATASPVTAEK